MEDALSDQAFEEWYNTIAKYSTTRLDTALAAWRACGQLKEGQLQSPCRSFTEFVIYAG